MMGGESYARAGETRQVRHQLRRNLRRLQAVKDYDDYRSGAARHIGAVLSRWRDGARGLRIVDWNCGLRGLVGTI